MNKKFDLDKAMANGGKCRTRAGRSARIICTDAGGKYPIVALLADSDGEEDPHSYTASGTFYYGDRDHSGHDLINIPERHVRWFVIYNPTQGWSTYEAAKQSAGRGAYAIKRIEFEEGEGL